MQAAESLNTHRHHCVVTRISCAERYPINDPRSVPNFEISLVGRIPAFPLLSRILFGYFLSSIFFLDGASVLCADFLFLFFPLCLPFVCSFWAGSSSHVAPFSDPHATDPIHTQNPLAVVQLEPEPQLQIEPVSVIACPSQDPDGAQPKYARLGKGRDGEGGAARLICRNDSGAIEGDL